MPLPTAGLSQPQNTWNTSTTQSKTANNPSNAAEQSEQNTTVQTTYTANTTGQISVDFDEISLLGDIEKIVSSALFKIDRHIRLEESNVEKHLATFDNQHELHNAPFPY